ncbi:hypothetical protein XcodCFBP4690_17145 [Xanthomonas codiaei]|uniref:Uncharacterized protein n=1 Tax=Xanthomonas codiaei TaxID=56463 RepID=A0A2S7CGW0_9XANT|nr:hypothetical protein XcodCFBP4690_17145 [Xanthomonas codiaei]
MAAAVEVVADLLLADDDADFAVSDGEEHLPTSISKNNPTTTTRMSVPQPDRFFGGTGADTG